MDNDANVIYFDLVVSRSGISSCTQNWVIPSDDLSDVE